MLTPPRVHTRFAAVVNISTNTEENVLVNIKCTDVSLGLAQLFTAVCLKRAAGRPLIACGPWGCLSVVVLSDLWNIRAWSQTFQPHMSCVVTWASWTGPLWLVLPEELRSNQVQYHLLSHLTRLQAGFHVGIMLNCFSRFQFDLRRICNKCSHDDE